MKNKHIVVVAGNYPSPGRQILVFVQELVHALIDLGLKVTVVAPQSLTHSVLHKQLLLPNYSTAKTENGVQYNVYRPYTITAGNNRILSKFTNWLNTIILSSVIKKQNPDILYTHFWSSTLLVYKFANVNNIPLFVACGEGDNALEDMFRSLTEKNLDLLSHTVTGVISVSSENKRKCIEYGLVDKDSIEVFPNCVNTSIFKKTDPGQFRKQLGLNEDDFLVAFVGGFIPRKGPDRIAKAISQLNDPNIKAFFIGKPFEGYPFDFDCPGIIYKGPMDHALIPQYLNCADVFVMPTQNEGCCNAIVEALAMGIPVISSDRPFNDDILNDENSIRINPNNVQEIANAIKILKDNPMLCKRMKEYSISKHNQYSISSRAYSILSFIDSQVKKHS